MKTPLLYPIVLLCVLLVAGCSGEEPTETVPEGSAEAVAPPPAAQAAEGVGSDAAINVLFLGNSLSAGYGLDPALAFPARVQAKIDSLGWDVRVINAGLSGETTAGGRTRVGWLMRQRVDVLVLELGGNDGLRGIDLEVTKTNLQAIIDSTRHYYPTADIVLAGMQVPPNLGHEYTQGFQQIYPTLAEANGAALIPFLLEGVGGVPSLNLPDGIHPTAAGHEIVAETVWQTLRPVLETRLEATT